MDDLLEHFLIEGRDLVAQGQADLAALARNPADARAIDGAFRAVHTLKGSVGLFDMAPAETLLHAAEDMLERARKGVSALDADMVARLVATLDQTDRWIDALERGEPIVATAPQETPGTDTAPEAEWAGALYATARLAGDAVPRTAFRYTPDADCFFRGDDPLAIVAAVPDLLALTASPLAGAWPALDGFEPFQCVTRLEGLSAAPVAAVRAAFRLVSDQVELAAVTPRAASVTAAESSAASTTSLRVDPARIDTLGDDLGELVVAANALAPLAARLERIDAAAALEVRTAQARIGRSVAALLRTVSAVRMVPLEPTLRRLPRLVREIAEQLGKTVRFDMRGQATEVDRQIAEGLFEPLLHLVRNAIDHGIEAAPARAAAGKPAEGTLSLGVAREGGQVIVTLGDDGAGIDPVRIRATAVARGLIDAEAAQALSDAQAIRLIFRPGFSTAAAVTGVSGRGVGMDAALAAIERLRGTIEIDSAPGAGTRFRLRLPAHAITTRILVVEAGGDRYGVPLDQIFETVRVAVDDLRPLGTGTAVVLRDRTVPVLDLATLLGGGSGGGGTRLLVTEADGAPVAVRVDGFGERIDTLVRPASGVLAAVPGVSGTTLTGGGDVLLVLDLPELLA
ncbi:chemotaxis protein CheA [Sphingomonas sp. NFR15]|uniref:chemotaxis protein CheA n=1 Tax=Sphingomonas sp. NFR15 TaxID=1566282 RepID=UPI0008884B25|nr:chemotaxis protein CheW [Sphingomonas sp. NFR15]SDA31674.1 two-component system, chemotaxis family, sensor kinase CheA [Sphingomonas sp. NFR15]